jgi:hypothetical protein
MSLVQGGYTFGDDYLVHGDVVEGPWAVPLVVHRFPGVAGESHLTAPPHGRELQCRVTFAGFASRAEAQAGLDGLSIKAGTLTGDLVLTGNVARTERHCTFLGFAPEPEGVRYDPSTGTFRVRGVLRWAQRGRNTDALGEASG